MKKLVLIITLFLLALATTPALAQTPEGEEYVVQADPGPGWVLDFLDV